jgi:hypothetical protein
LTTARCLPNRCLASLQLICRKSFIVPVQFVSLDEVLTANQP